MTFSIVAATLQLRFEFTEEARSAQRKNFIKKYSETLRPLGPCSEDDSENSPLSAEDAETNLKKKIRARELRAGLRR